MAQLDVIVVCLLLTLTSLNTGVVTLDFGGLNFGGLFNTKSVTGNVSCPFYCQCEQISMYDFFETVFQENAQVMGQGSRPDVKKTITSILKALKGNFFLRILMGGKLLVNMTCDVTNSTTSLDNLFSQAKGIFIIATIACPPNTTVGFDAYPSSIFLFSLKISGCTIRSTTKWFTFPPFNSLTLLELNNLNIDWLNMLDISNLNSVRLLKVSNHNLGKLPVAWTNSTLNSLAILDLRNNSLTEFNCEIGWGSTAFLFIGPSIDTINFEDNLLAEIPRCLLEKRLMIPYISLARNKISSTTVFREISSYVRAYSLNLRENQIRVVDMFTFSNMSALDMSHNLIESLSARSFRAIGDFNLLERLDLSNNRIRRIEYGSLDFTPALKYLDLSHNKLRSFDFEVSPIYNKNITINLGDNYLEYPPFSNTGYMGPPAVRIMAANNPFACDCWMYQFVTTYNQMTGQRDSYATGHFSSFLFASRPFSDANLYRCERPTYFKGRSVIAIEPDPESCPIVHACPRVCKCERLKHYIHVDCSNQNMTKLPERLPDDLSLKLNFRGNRIRAVEYHPYLKRTTEVDLSFNNIRNISVSAMQALLHVSQVSLRFNSLRSLPQAIETFENVSVLNITLADNPWNCSCETVWMKSWLIGMQGRVSDVGQVICQDGVFSGQNFLSVDKEAMKCFPQRYVKIAIALGVIFILLVVLSSLVYWKRLEIRIVLYTRFQWDILKKDDSRSDLPYDVFVSFSQHDYKWVVHSLVPALEQRDPPYKLCLHQRDFPVGEPIAESIANAVVNSRCTVMLVTDKFLESEWCMYEFKTAHERLFRTKDSKVVVLLQDNLDTKGMDKTLAGYIKTHTYIKMKDKLFWKKLLFALPKERDLTK